MNPMLPLLAFLSLVGLLFRRRGQGLGAGLDLGLAWAACGLAGIALLYPALRLPDGVPSGSAILARHAPWQGIAELGAGNPNLYDVTHMVEPWLIFLRQEFRSGRPAFWDPHQFSGSPYWSNGSGAPLFPLHLLFAALPLQVGLVLLPWMRIVIGGCGTWALARELGLGRPASLVAALIFPLSGIVTSFLLWPIGNALALVPWVLFATERLATGRGGWAGLALAGGLQLLAGHPETPVFTGLLGVVYLLVRCPCALATWGRFVAGWSVALAIAAIQLLPLALTLLHSGKWLHWAPSSPPPANVLLACLLRLLLPDLFGNPADGTWWGPYNFAGSAIYAGAATLPLAAAGLAAARRDRAWLAVAVMTAFALAAAYQAPGVRDLLLALPVIQHGLHHYLRFGVELGLALLAAVGCERWLAGKGRGLLVGVGVVFALVAAAWWRFARAWQAHDLTGLEAAWTVGVVSTAGLLGLSLLLVQRWRRAVWPLLPLVLLVDLLAAHARTNPGLSIARLYPVTGAVRFLQGRPERVVGLGTALHPNAAMVYGLYDVRGDNPVKLDRYDAVYGALAARDPIYFHPVQDWTNPWLDRLSVRWVVGGPAEEPPPGLQWRLAYAGADARVFERPHALPLVRLADGARGGQVRVERRTAGAWDIAWEAPHHGRLVVAENWDAGWRAEVDGAAVPVEAEDGLLLSVPVGSGKGRIRLRYHPDGIVWGALLSLIGCGVVAADPLRRLRWRGTRAPSLF